MTGRYSRPARRSDIGRALLCAVLLVGCSRVEDVTGDGIKRVACWGDSNTIHWPEPNGHPAWCEYLAAQMPAGWTAVNVSFWGMTAGPISFLYAMGWFSAVTDNTDAVVIALGTNDIGKGRTPEQVVHDIQKLVDAAATAQLPPGKRRAVYVLTIPPRTDSPAQEAIAATNKLLHATFGDRVIAADHETLLDGLHFDDAAAHARADAVWRALSH